MDKAAETTLPETPSGIVKKVFSFIGKSLLLLFGVIGVATLLILTFEQSLSFLEISTMEMIYFVVIFYLLKRHRDVCLRANITWQQILYRPLRNVGWYYLVIYSLVLIDALSDESITICYTCENYAQLFNCFVVAACVYFAAPKVKTEVNASPQPPESLELDI